MITINLFRNESRKIVRFTVSGHAGYSEQGTDIVCASVTTAAFTALNGLLDVAKIDVEFTVRDGYLDCCLPENLSEKNRSNADLLLESMVLSFQNLEEQYGKFVKLQNKRG